MDNFGSNFALQQDDELVFQNTIPSFACEIHTIPEDFVINYTHASLDRLDGDFLAINNSLGENNLAINVKGKRQQKSSAFQDDDKQKKIIRRDNERKRRQEMTKLCESLRMQLPLEYIKECSVLDLLHKAANYVKHKEMNIEELKAMRDTLKNLTAANDLNSTDQSSSCSCLPTNVTVRSFLGSIEILISVDMRRDTFPLSRVLEVVLAKGLSVVSCFCTKANGRTLHTIQIEVSDLGVDIYELQEELTDIVNTP